MAQGCVTRGQPALGVGDSPPKGGLIPHVASGDIAATPKLGLNLAFPDGPAAYQLVGGVTAHQGDDG